MIAGIAPPPVVASMRLRFAYANPAAPRWRIVKSYIQIQRDQPFPQAMYYTLDARSSVFAPPPGCLWEVGRKPSPSHPSILTCISENPRVSRVQTPSTSSSAKARR
ncbi:uncharacterized protein VTP21DRAFT_10403 [Calcarisporiella thermophila]|uniref:uncharacterized protein n=1 Tax=Calcarisporiella thermophila TaxID=911321 RepID=UPI003742FE7D